MEWSNSIYIIYIPKFDYVFSAIYKSDSFFEQFKMLNVELQGLNLFELEAARFWARIYCLNEVIYTIDDKYEQFNKMKNF